jgi:predicted nucleic acid-binding protein
LNRPFDDLSDNTVRMEAEATLSIIDASEAGEWSLFSSDVLLDEILNITDVGRREKVLLLYSSANEHIDLTDEIIARAKSFERHGVTSYDALHIASAEAVGANVFLTTDRKLVNAARRAGIEMVVMNPLIWLTEALYGRES